MLIKITTALLSFSNQYYIFYLYFQFSNFVYVAITCSPCSKEKQFFSSFFPILLSPTFHHSYYITIDFSVWRKRIFQWAWSRRTSCSISQMSITSNVYRSNVGIFKLDNTSRCLILLYFLYCIYFNTYNFGTQPPVLSYSILLVPLHIWIETERIVSKSKKMSTLFPLYCLFCYLIENIFSQQK